MLLKFYCKPFAENISYRQLGRKNMILYYFILCLSVVLNVKSSDTSVPHYKVRSVSDAQILGQHIHHEIDMAYKGIERIISWTDLNLTTEDLVDIKLTTAQMSSMSAMGTYQLLRKFIFEEIRAFCDNLTSIENKTVNTIDTSNRTLTKEEYNDMVNMYLAFSGWFHVPSNLTQLIDASQIFFDLKRAIKNKKSETVKTLLLKLIESASSHLPRVHVVRKTIDDLTVAPVFASSSSEPITEQENIQTTSKPNKSNRRKNKTRKRKRKVMKKSLETLTGPDKPAAIHVV